MWLSISAFSYPWLAVEACQCQPCNAMARVPSDTDLTICRSSRRTGSFSLGSALDKTGAGYPARGWLPGPSLHLGWGWGLGLKHARTKTFPGKPLALQTHFQNENRSNVELLSVLFFSASFHVPSGQVSQGTGISTPENPGTFPGASGPL